MSLTPEIKEYLERSVLCWLATVSADGMPNVSPKEAFHYFADDRIIIANIASPQTLKNIRHSPKVCVSFIDVFVQLGFQIKGQARIVTKEDVEYPAMEKILTGMTHGKFPFSSITEITIQTVKKIIAPSYLLYPETTESDQIASAKKAYGL